MIDLRSDTLTLPNDDMIETIKFANFGDSSRLNEDGRGEDATVNELEDFAAKLTGMERSLLFPSGTLANTVAILTYCNPGDQVLLDNMQHVYLSEKVVFDKSLGQLEPLFYSLDSKKKPDLQSIKEQLDQHKVKLICIENSHNFAGGICLNIDDLKQISLIAKAYNVPIHMDGARLFNASSSISKDAMEVCKYVDSVMFCLSKGLGAPMGSMLCSTNAFIEKAIEKKKILGGNMRQAGVIAAPGLYALQNNLLQLQNDNSKAKVMHEKLKTLKTIIPPDYVHSNIVMLDVSNASVTPKAVCKLAEEKGLLIRPILEKYVRLVIYNDIDLEQVQKAAMIILEIDKVI